MHFRLAIRALRGAKAYVVAISFIMALAFTFLGVVFSLASGVLLRPLPFDVPAELVVIDAYTPGERLDEPARASWNDLRIWREAVPDMRVAVAGAVSVLGTSQGRSVMACAVSPGFLNVLGVEPTAGRVFVREDAEWFRRLQPDIRPAAPIIVTAGFFARAFGGDPAAVGDQRVLRLGERSLPVRLVGVLPPDFVFPHGAIQPDVLAVLPPPRDSGTAAGELFLIGRVPEQRRPEVLSRLNTATQPRLVLELRSLSSYLRSREMAQALLLLTAAGVTWLMTLATVASLTRGRAHRRAREFAIHLALGANRRTLASVALLESLLLGLIAAAAALIGAWPLISWTARVLPDTLLLIRPIQFDLRTVVILVAAAAAAIVVMVLASVKSTASPMHAQRSGPDDNVRRRTAGLLLTGHVAVALSIVALGTQMISSLLNAAAMPLGYEPDRLIAVGINSSTDVPGASVHDVIQHLAALPGVEAVGAWTGRLLRQTVEFGPGPFSPPGSSRAAGTVAAYGVTREFFDVLDLPPIAGRLPEANEWVPSTPFAVVSERAARLFWPAGDAIGGHLAQPHGPPVTVVGVVGDARYRSPDADPIAVVFVPAAPVPASTSGELLIRTAGSAGALLRQVTQRVTATSPWTIAWASTGHDLARESLRMRRLRAGLSGGFGFTALSTLAAGMLGLLILELRRRSRELAIRRCLGARESDIALMVGQIVFVPVFGGLLLGTGLTTVSVPLLSSYLYGEFSNGTAVVAVSSAVVLGVTASATVVSVLLSRRTDPAELLRISM